MRDEERVWLTYEEAGEALGIKAASAKRLSFRRHWPHRAGNDGLARVGVAVAELRRVTGGVTGDAAGDVHRVAPGDDSGASPVTAPGDKPNDTAALALALDRIEVLAGQVGHARAEVERLRAEVVEAVRGRAEAEGTAADARRRAEGAERAAVEAWGTARPGAAPGRRPAARGAGAVPTDSASAQGLAGSPAGPLTGPGQTRPGMSAAS